MVDGWLVDGRLPIPHLEFLVDELKEEVDRKLRETLGIVVGAIKSEGTHVWIAYVHTYVEIDNLTKKPYNQE